MKTPVILILILALHLSGFGQFWVAQGAGLSGSSLFIGDISAVDANTSWAIAASFAGGFCGTPVKKYTRTTDGGEHWTGGTVALPLGYTIWNISAIDDQVAWISCFELSTVSSGRIYKTENGGQTWVWQETANFTSAAKFVHFFDASQGVAVGENEVFTTTDGGDTWTAQDNLPMDWSAFFIINSYETFNDHIWLGDGSGIVLHSADRGLHWEIAADQSAGLGQWAIKGLAFKDEMHGMAVASQFQSSETGGGVDSDYGNIFLTSDGGHTWNMTTFNVNSETPVYYDAAKYDVEYVPGTVNDYIMTSEYFGTQTWSAISHDGGLSWDLLDSLPHTAIDFNDDGSGWCGGYITNGTTGIFKHNNNATGIIESTESVAVKVKNIDNSIEITGAFSSHNLGLARLYTLDGRLTLVAQLSNYVQRINVEGISSGVYILLVESNGKSVKQKLAINASNVR